MVYKLLNDINDLQIIFMLIIVNKYILKNNEMTNQFYISIFQFFNFSIFIKNLSKFIIVMMVKNIYQI